MITRYALFEGEIKAGQEEAFRADVLAKILPLWKKMPGALAVRVGFAQSRDEGAPNLSMILAIDYPDLQAVKAVMASPERAASAQATQEVLTLYFKGRIHHHVTQAQNYTLA